MHDFTRDDTRAPSSRESLNHSLRIHRIRTYTTYHCIHIYIYIYSCIIYIYIISFLFALFSRSLSFYIYKSSFSMKIISSAPVRFIALVCHLPGDGAPETGNRARTGRLRPDHRPINTRTGSPVPATWESPSDGQKQQRQETQGEVKDELCSMGHARTLSVRRQITRWPHRRRAVVPIVVWKQIKLRYGCFADRTQLGQSCGREDGFYSEM